MRKEERETETERGGREVSRAAALPIAGNGKASNLFCLTRGEEPASLLVIRTSRLSSTLRPSEHSQVAKILVVSTARAGSLRFPSQCSGPQDHQVVQSAVALALLSPDFRTVDHEERSDSQISNWPPQQAKCGTGRACCQWSEQKYGTRLFKIA